MLLRYELELKHVVSSINKADMELEMLRVVELHLLKRIVSVRKLVKPISGTTTSAGGAPYVNF